MEVINLATRENQELILSYFPIKEGTNFSEYQAFLYSQYITDNYEKLVLDITGKGFLNLLQTNGDAVRARIIIDDNSELMFHFGKEYGTLDNLMLFFNTSLKVYLAKTGTTSTTAYIIYSLKGE